MWVGESVADVKQPQAVLPTKNLTLTCYQPLPGLVLDLFVRTPLAYYGAVGQKERWTPMVPCGSERVKDRLEECVVLVQYDSGSADQ